MTRSMIVHLVKKDWYLQRYMIAGGLGGGIVCLLLMGLGGEGMFLAGTIGLITVLVTVGCGLTFSTVVTERKEQTLAFVMSLPVTPHDYVVAKLIANATIFLVPWGGLVAGCVGLILLRPGVPDGMIPMTVLTLTEILVGSTLVLTVAIMTESETFTVAALLIGNLAVNAVIFMLARVPSIGGTMKSESLAWSPAALTALGVELSVIAALVALTFFVQGRKTSFL